MGPEWERISVFLAEFTKNPVLENLPSSCRIDKHIILVFHFIVFIY